MLKKIPNDTEINELEEYLEDARSKNQELKFQLDLLFSLIADSQNLKGNSLIKENESRMNSLDENIPSKRSHHTNLSNVQEVYNNAERNELKEHFLHIEIVRFKGCDVYDIYGTLGCG